MSKHLFALALLVCLTYPVQAAEVSGGSDFDTNFNIFPAAESALVLEKCLFPRVSKHCWLEANADGLGVVKVLLYQRLNSGKLLPINMAHGKVLKTVLDFKDGGFYSFLAVAVDKHGQLVAADGDSFFVDPNSYTPRSLISSDEEETNSDSTYMNHEVLPPRIGFP